MLVKAEEIKRLGIDMLKTAGATAEEAEIVAEILVDTSLHGIDSHGVRALPRYCQEVKRGSIVSPAPIKVLRETPSTAMWDNGKAFGFVAAKKAMDTAIEKAKKHKIGSVGYMGTGHNGALYYYATLATKHDMIGMVLQRGARTVAAPYGGKEGRLGTNPFSIGIPAGVEKPIILDCATNAVATGHFLTMSLRGQEIPEGWLIDADGNWVTKWDAKDVAEGRILPVSFGGKTQEYKGYGIKIILEAICGAIGVGCSLDEKGFGCMFIAIDPSGFCPTEDFKARIDSMIRHVKSSATRPGFNEVFLPGEIEYNKMVQRRREGIFVDDAFWKDILRTTKELGIDVNDYIKM